MNEKLSEDLYGRFEEWDDDACRRKIPPAVIAFNFNLAETLESFDIDLIGAPHFDANNNEWPATRGL